MRPLSPPPRTAALTALVAAVAALLAASPAFAAESPSAGGASPIFKAGNPTCATLLAPDAVLAEHKIDPPNSTSAPVTITAGARTAQLTMAKSSSPLGQVVAFTVTGDLVASAVFVKASDGGNLYDYRPGGSSGDSGLHGPVAPGGTYHDVSHVSFCFAAKPPRNPDPDPRLEVVKQTTSGTRSIASAQPFAFELGGAVTDAPTLDTDPATATPSHVLYQPAGPATVVVAEGAAPAGWTLASLLCSGATVEYGTLANGTFSPGTGGWDPGENAARLTLAKGDDATCTFTNDKAPDPPPTPPTVITTTTPVLAPPVVAAAPSLVRPAAPRAPRVVRGTARLQAPEGCRNTVFTVRILGREIRRVTIAVDGRRVRTFRTARSRYRVRIDPSRLRSREAHRITVRVVFTRASRTRARTLRSTFQRCLRRGIAPRFTG